MTFLKFLVAVHNALKNRDYEELEHLEKIEPSWFDQIMSDYVCDNLNKIAHVFMD